MPAWHQLTELTHLAAQLGIRHVQVESLHGLFELLALQILPEFSWHCMSNVYH